jgi:hypothetical protein
LSHVSVFLEGCLAIAGVATVSHMSQQDSVEFQNLAETPMDLGVKFFNLNQQCDDWYLNAQNAFLKSQDDFVPQAKFMWEHKLLLTKYGRDDYHSSMN